MNEPHPPSSGPPVKYPYLIRVRHGRPVPARKDGPYYVCAYETFLGLWWSPREVTVLEYDPHRDFYREQRQARLSSPSRVDATGGEEAGSSGVPAAQPKTRDTVVARRVRHHPLPDTAPPPESPGIGW